MINIYYDNKKGEWEGKLNQKLIQVETDLKFKLGDVHPNFSNLRFLSYRNEKRSRLIFPNGKKIPKDHHRYLEPTIVTTQRWQSLEDFEKNMAKRKEKQRIERGYYSEERVEARENQLDQKALQVKDTGFKTYDPHPYVEGVIFQSYRHSEGGKQRWMRGDENSRGHQSRARVLQEQLQTGNEIGYWSRGNLHPQNKDYVFAQYVSADERFGGTDKILHNGLWYRKQSPERWVRIGEKWSPPVVCREESLQRRMNQKLQTGEPRQTWSSRDPHPENSEYIFKQYRNSKTSPECWVLKDSKSAPQFKDKTIIQHEKLQVTGDVTFERRDPHPTVPNLFYWQSKDGKQLWYPMERIEEYTRKHQLHCSTPEYKEYKHTQDKLYRSTPEFIFAASIRRKQLRHDPQFNIRKSLDSKLQRWLFTYSNRSEAEYYLGCTIEEAKQKFEQLFFKCPKTDVDMTWSNYGKYQGLSDLDYNLGHRTWHIDHIVPCKEFDLVNHNDQLQCYNIQNIRPLWGWMNMSKGAKLDYEIPQKI